MRKPRDYAAELKALDQRARDLKEKKLRQLGELVEATGADALDLETLAGGLLATVELSDAGRKEKLRERGAAKADGANILQLWQRRGRRAFEAEVVGKEKSRPTS